MRIADCAIADHRFAPSSGGGEGGEDFQAGGGDLRVGGDALVGQQVGRGEEQHRAGIGGIEVERRRHFARAFGPRADDQDAPGHHFGVARQRGQQIRLGRVQHVARRHHTWPFRCSQHLTHRPPHPAIRGMRLYQRDQTGNVHT